MKGISISGALLGVIVITTEVLQRPLSVMSLILLGVIFLSISAITFVRNERKDDQQGHEERIKDLEARVKQMGALDNYRKINKR